MSRVLVTGGSGFLGGPTVRALVAAGHDVVSMGRTPTAAPAHVAVDLLGDHFATVIPPVDVLLHLAWFAAPGWSSNDENVIWVARSLDLVRAFLAAGGRRVVVAGSGAEYGDPGPLPVAEDAPLQPLNLYGAAKAGLHCVLTSWSQAAEFTLAWPRLFNVYGPGERPDRLVPSVSAAVLGGRPARCSAGEQVRDFVYVDDAAEALASLVDAEVVGPLNIASGVGRTVADVATAVAVEAGAVHLLRLGELGPGDAPPVLVADVARARKTLGWTASTPIDVGVARTVAWCRSR